MKSLEPFAPSSCHWARRGQPRDRSNLAAKNVVLSSHNDPTFAEKKAAQYRFNEALDLVYSFMMP